MSAHNDAQNGIELDHEHDDMPQLEQAKSSNLNKLKVAVIMVFAACVIFAAAVMFSKKYETYRVNKKAQEQAELVKKTVKDDTSDFNITAAQAKLAPPAAVYTSVDSAGNPICKTGELPVLMPTTGKPSCVLPTDEKTGAVSNTPVSGGAGGSVVVVPNPQAQANYNQSNGKPELTPAQLLRQREQDGEILLAGGAKDKAGGLATSGGSGGSNTAYSPTLAANDAPQSQNNSNSFEKSLQSSKFKATVAMQRDDLTHLLRHGTVIPCVLKTKIDTTYSGFVTCQVTKDVYSANGKLLLIDRGSDITGEQKTQVAQGMARVFVLWTQLETPTGVTVNIDSPITDSLGATGVGAYVDNHWWARFGGAIMLSLIQDAVGAVAQQSQNQQGGITYNNTTQASQDMAAQALKNTINIPPTAHVNQGALVNVMVARDVDFSSIYALAQSTNPKPVQKPFF
jgi:type IV secretion system protein VirB10